MGIKDHLKSKFMACFFTVLSAGFVSGCNQNDKKENKEPPVEVNLSQEEAIAELQHYLRSERKTIKIQTHYYKWEKEQVKCTQYDIDAGRDCSEPTVLAPYGYRYERERVRKCCKHQSRRIIQLKGEWKASHSLEDDKWSITFEVDNKLLKEPLKWLLDDNTADITDNNDYQNREI